MTKLGNYKSEENVNYMKMVMLMVASSHEKINE